MPRLLLVADGDTSRTAQLWIGDLEITDMTRRFTLDVDAAGVATCNLVLLPREGFEIELDAQTIVAFVPLSGFRWIKTARPDGGWMVRCERGEAMADADQRSLFDCEAPVCRFCGGDDSSPNHWLVCDGRQGTIEARIIEAPPRPPDFDGETYVRPRDHDRLFAQLAKVQSALGDHGWHTLPELELVTGAPEASISARLRDLRKPKFGAYQVERRYVAAGLWEYRLLAPHPMERAG